VLKRRPSGSLTALIDGLTLARPRSAPPEPGGLEPPAGPLPKERVRAWVEAQCSSDVVAAVAAASRSFRPAARPVAAAGPPASPAASAPERTAGVVAGGGAQLHRCGTPPAPLSLRRVDSPSNRTNARSCSLARARSGRAGGSGSQHQVLYD